MKELMAKANRGKGKKRNRKAVPKHKAYLGHIPGSGDTITDYSVTDNYKYIAVSSKSGSFKVFNLLKTLKGNKDYKEYKCKKFYPNCVSISQSGKKVIMARANDNAILTLKLHKKGFKDVDTNKMVDFE